jgi:glycosyltransferase involved in cell wall biosynthesis
MNPGRPAEDPTRQLTTPARARASFKLGIVFIGGFPPSIARLAEYNYEVIKTVAEKLVKHEAQIYVLANRADMFTNSEITFPNNVKVFYIWRENNTLLVLLKLIRMRRENNILILSFYHGVFGSSAAINFLSVFFILIIAKILNYKIITILHTLPEIRKETFAIFGKPFSYIYCMGSRITSLFIFNISNRTILPVKTYYDLLSNASPSLRSKISYIFHGVPNYINCRVKKLVPRDKITVAFIGLISSRKNISELIEALNKVRQLLEFEIELVLIGAPHPYLFHEASSLIRQIKKSCIRVKYLGYLDTKELQEYVSKHVDVIVLPYKLPTGTSGIAHIVAPAATPIIMPSFLEYIELYRDGYGLKLFNAHNENISAELAKAITEILANPAKYEELSKRTSAFAKTHDVTLTSLMLLKEIINLYRRNS